MQALLQTHPKTDTDLIEGLLTRIVGRPGIGLAYTKAHRQMPDLLALGTMRLTRISEQNSFTFFVAELLNCIYLDKIK